MLKRGAYFALLAWFVPVYANAQSLPGGRFPLMAWDFADSPKLLQSMHDAGINSVAFVRPDMLDACQNFDLKCIVFDERLAGDNWSKPFNGDQFVRNLPAVLSETKDKPAVYGYHIKDEPNATEFPELAKAVAAVKKMAPGKWPYINLLPGTSKEHEKYVSDFISICSPTALSYDRYSIIGDTGSGDLDPDFWTNLEQFREQAVKNYLPMWNIVLSSPHWRYRELTEDDLRLEIWGSLFTAQKGSHFISSFRGSFHSACAGFGEFPGRSAGSVLRAYSNLVLASEHGSSSAEHRIDFVEGTQRGCLPYRRCSPRESWPKRAIAGAGCTGRPVRCRRFYGRQWTALHDHCEQESQAFRSPPSNVRPDIKAANVVSSITGEIRPLTQYFWLAPGQGVLLQLK